MASMSLDPSSALAEKYKGNRQILEQAVLGRSAEPIDPYSALRALQKLNVADRYEQMQKAMAGQPNPPSIAEQTVAQAAQAPQSGGLAAMPVPEESFNMAGGGLVAFADGGLSDLEFPTTFSPEDIAYGEQYGEGYRKAFDPEAYYSKRAKQIEEMEAMGPEELEQQKGLAALQAAAAMSQGSDFTRGLGGALGAFGETYGTAVKESNKEKRALAQMQAEMEDARRKEEAALYKDTRAATQEAYGRRTEQAKFNLDVAKAQAELAAQREQNAAALAAAAAKGQKDPSDWKFTYQEQLGIVYPDIRAEIASDPANKGRTEKELDILATRRAQEVALTKTSKLLGKDLSEVKAALQAGNLGVKSQEEAADQALQLALLMGDTYISASPEQQAQIIDNLTKQIQARQTATGAGFMGVGSRPADAVRLRQPAQ
jgi:hypothetical protein